MMSKEMKRLDQLYVALVRDKRVFVGFFESALEAAVLEGNHLIKERVREILERRFEIDDNRMILRFLNIFDYLQSLKEQESLVLGKIDSQDSVSEEDEDVLAVASRGISVITKLFDKVPESDVVKAVLRESAVVRAEVRRVLEVEQIFIKGWKGNPNIKELDSLELSGQSLDFLAEGFSKLLGELDDEDAEFLAAIEFLGSLDIMNRDNYEDFLTVKTINGKADELNILKSIFAFGRALLSGDGLKITRMGTYTVGRVEGVAKDIQATLHFIDNLRWKFGSETELNEQAKEEIVKFLKKFGSFLLPEDLLKKDKREELYKNLPKLLNDLTKILKKVLEEYKIILEIYLGMNVQWRTFGKKLRYKAAIAFCDEKKKKLAETNGINNIS